eukprot:TRINITY_DN3868_c0_g1_i1.p1 TRINITY_DN3868_c0_g1~~TRINITY_DN3868_c0_g1_i1.p1  ORF type:complete len:400 (-),score=122.43 TRINITY_DN3868_c0_g1_i1:194-1393(-)
MFHFRETLAVSLAGVEYTARNRKKLPAEEKKLFDQYQEVNSWLNIGTLVVGTTFWDKLKKVRLPLVAGLASFAIVKTGIIFGMWGKKVVMHPTFETGRFLRHLLRTAPSLGQNSYYLRQFEQKYPNIDDQSEFLKLVQKGAITMSSPSPLPTSSSSSFSSSSSSSTNSPEPSRATDVVYEENHMSTIGDEKISAVPSSIRPRGVSSRTDSSSSSPSLNTNTDKSNQQQHSSSATMRQYGHYSSSPESTHDVHPSDNEWSHSDKLDEMKTTSSSSFFSSSSSSSATSSSSSSSSGDIVYTDRVISSSSPSIPASHPQQQQQSRRRNRRSRHERKRAHAQEQADIQAQQPAQQILQPGSSASSSDSELVIDTANGRDDFSSTKRASRKVRKNEFGDEILEG